MVSLAHLSPQPKWHLDQFSHFCRAHDCDRPRYSICNNRSHLASQRHGIRSNKPANFAVVTNEEIVHCEGPLRALLQLVADTRQPAETMLQLLQKPTWRSARLACCYWHPSHRWAWVLTVWHGDCHTVNTATVVCIICGSLFVWNKLPQLCALITIAMSVATGQLTTCFKQRNWKYGCILYIWT